MYTFCAEKSRHDTFALLCLCYFNLPLCINSKRHELPNGAW